MAGGKRKIGFWKRLGQNERVRRLASGLISFYIRLCFATGRWEVRGGEHPARLWAAGNPFILAFWHGRLLMMPKIWTSDRKVNILISQHRDGNMIARSVESFGLGTIRGSTRKEGKKREKGGLGAVLAMSRALKKGESIGITPDGPRGPARQASEGVITLARLAGVPIVPAAVSARPAITAKSWDSFQVPLPFARCAFVWGAPIEIGDPRTPEEIEAIRARLESAINRVTEAADAHVAGRGRSTGSVGATADA